MIILAVFIFLLLIFNFFLIKQKIYGIFFFNLIWLVSSILLSLNVYRLDEINYNTVLVLMLGILFFNIGGLAKFSKSKNINKNIENIRLKYFYVYYIILTQISFYYLLKTIPKIRKYGFTYVKGAAYSIDGYEALYGNTKIAMFMDLYTVVLGMVSFLILLGALFNTRKGCKIQKKIKFLLLISILNTVIQMVYTGARFKVVNMTLLFMLYLFYCKKIRIKHIVLFIILLVPFYIATSIMNKGKVFEQVSIYLTGSIVILDKFINSNHEFWYGKMFISTLEYPITIILRFFSKSYTPILTEYYSEFSKNIYIGNKYYYNALYTIFHPFFLDFGVLGVILISFFYGILYKYIYSKFSTTNFRKIVIVCIDLYLILSIFKNNFINFNNFLAILFLIIAVTKIESKGSNTRSI